MKKTLYVLLQYLAHFIGFIGPGT